MRLQALRLHNCARLYSISAAIAVVLAFSAVSTAPSASSSQEKWVLAKGRSLISNKSPEAARREAILLAENAALESIVREISSSRSLDVTDVDGARDESFHNWISSRTHGFIKDKEILSDETVIERTDDGRQLLWQVIELKALVQCDPITEPSPYDVRIGINRTTFEAGDDLRLTIAVSRACYLHVFNETADGNVYILHPLHPDDARQVAAQSVVDFPPRDRIIRMYPLSGHDVDYERIRVIATESPIELSGADVRQVRTPEDYSPARVIELVKLYSHIMRIPSTKRGESFVTITVQERSADKQ